ncbi:myosin light chain kinase 2, skeletal/cardiac muscle [Corapipo altera]|uniref:myosin light chain kinase 2, skeletal/cardiac muscle n=1 Tax=Corapipo altera TaxID=415028 RepID=UPI000FD62D2F|nr:myosin light chain kinase 2, skeletal/cardiac muscle [Corapipo altera]
MEQGSGVDGADTGGGAGGTAPPEADGSAAPATPQAAQPQGGTAPAATAAQDGGTDDPGQEKVAGEAGGGKPEPEQGTALSAPEPRDGREAVPGEEASTVQHNGEQAASVGEKVLAATEAQGVGKEKKDEPGKTKTPVVEEPKGEKAASIEGKAPAAAKAQDRGKGEKDEPGKKKTPAAGELKGEKAPVAAKEKDREKDEPREEKAPALGEPEGGQAAPMEAKGPAVTEAQDGEKDKLRKEQAPGGSGPEGGGKAEPTEKKVPAAANSEGGKAKSTEETALAAAQTQDGGKGELANEETTAVAKEKVPATAKSSDGGKQAAKAEQAPADNKAPKEKITASVKEEAQASAKAQCGENKVIKEEKAPAAKKTPDGGKEEPVKDKAPAPTKDKASAPEKEKAPAPVKEKAIIPAKEKAPDAAMAQDGEKAAAKTEKNSAEKMAQGGGKKEPAKEKAQAAAKVQDGGKKTAKAEKNTVASKAEDEGKDPAKEKVPVAAKARDGGKKAAEVEAPAAAAEAGDGAEEPAESAAMVTVKAQGEGEEEPKGTEKQPPKVPEPPRPALLQSLSCPAACHREEQPWAEVVEMETIPEETTAVEPKEGPTEPGPAPPAMGDLQPHGTPQERTLPSATGQPPDPAGVVEQPGPERQPPSTEAKPPPSPYLTPDFGKEDPFEILDDVPPPPAPFEHRIVTLHSGSVSSQFSLNSKDILGGGKFGEVHTCTEKETGLKLAAKVIRKQGPKDKEMVLLEIDVMNQLNHHNLIQLYDAIETPREIILFMEFVEGGELFERIIDDDYHLTEVDCMVFVRQICEGIRFMHHMHVLHLDLKPENILCVSATGHMVKIIDFGLARRYNPNEKLKVNFGTPEFLSPEVVNYEQVSYTTDMWSMGVITYMLLSGLSPFLGDDDTETLNNVLAANWYFDEETFESVSNEAKDFVSNLIIKDKSARMSADQCLQHPWLKNLAEKAKRCNRRLKSQVLLKKYVMRRRWKKNFIGVCAANRFRKITSSGSLTALGV